MPLLILGSIIINLFSWIFIASEIYLWRQWFLYKDVIINNRIDNDVHNYAQRCLIGAIALLVYILLGKRLIGPLLGKRRINEEAPKAVRCPEQEQITRVDGTVIHIEHCGVKGKQTIFFIHGCNSNSMQWYYQEKYFSKNYHLILMDLPGFGLSSKPVNNNYSIDNLAADLNLVIEKTKPVDPVIWGHSMGGFVILKYCKLFKDKLVNVKGIILEHTTYTNPTKTSVLSSILTAIQEPLLKPLCYIMIALAPVLWLSKWLGFLNGNSLIQARVLTFAGSQTYQQLNFAVYLSTVVSPAVTGRAVLAMFNYDVTAALREITVPALIISAVYDKLTMPVASEYMRVHIPKSKLTVLNLAGHMGFIERHQQVNEAADRFVNSLIDKSL